MDSIPQIDSELKTLLDQARELYERREMEAGERQAKAQVAESARRAKFLEFVCGRLPECLWPYVEYGGSGYGDHNDTASLEIPNLATIQTSFVRSDETWVRGRSGWSVTKYFVAHDYLGRPELGREWSHDYANLLDALAEAMQNPTRASVEAQLAEAQVKETETPRPPSLGERLEALIREIVEDCHA